MKHLLSLVLIMSLLGFGLLSVSAQDALTPDEICAAADTAEPETRSYSGPEDVLEAGVNYQAIFCTEVGAVYVDLFESETPMTVNSFVFLAQNGYYNNSVFHRVIENFMVQGGDPVGTPAGTGGPGYQFDDEPIGFLTFDRPGLLAMANAGPSTNGSQFFITTVPTDWLDYRHTIFGEVLEGYSVVESIPDNQSDTSQTVTLNTVLIITDPSSVSVELDLPSQATEDDFTSLFASLNAEVVSALDTLVGPGLSDILVYNEAASGVFPTEAWLDLAANADLAEYYSATPPAFHAHASVNNTDCDLAAFPLTQLSYTIDVYEDAASAAEVYQSGAFAELQAERGFEALENETVNVDYYLGQTSGCDTDDLALARAHFQRGRFIITSDVAYVEGSFTPDTLLEASVLTRQLNGLIFDFAMRDLMRPELR